MMDIGSLFDDTGPSATSEATGYNISLPREPHGFCGIKNQGSTCYLNALLQTLFHTSSFRGKAVIIIIILRLLTSFGQIYVSIVRNYNNV